MSKLEKRFHTWWHEEGKFQVPQTSDYEAIKELIKVAFLNGAYVQTEIMIELNSNKKETKWECHQWNMC